MTFSAVRFPPAVPRPQCAHTRGAEAIWQPSEELPPRSILRQGVRRPAAHSASEGNADAHIRHPEAAPQEQTLLRPRAQLLDRRRQSVV